MTTDDATRTGLGSLFDTLRRAPVTRRTDDRWAGGVAAGVADRLGVDPLVVRVGVLVLACVGGLGAVAYGLAWLALPDTDGRIEAEEAVRGDVSGATVAAVLLVLLAGLVPNPWAFWWGGPVFDGGFAGPIVIAALVVGGVAYAARRDAQDAPGAPASGAPADVPPVARPRTSGPGAAMTTATLGVALLVGGGVAIAATVVENAGETLPASVRLLTAAAVTVVLGTATVALGLAGRRDGAVGGFALLAALATVAFAAIPSVAQVHAVGDARWTPTSVADAERGYAFGAGDARLDLTRLEVGGQDGDVVVPVATGLGNLRVVVPADVPVVVRSASFVGAGSDAALPDGWSVTGRPDGFLTSGEFASPTGADDEARLVVDASTFIGAIEITEEAR